MMADTDPYHGIPRDAATFRPTQALRCPLCETCDMSGVRIEEWLRTGYEFSCACGFNCWVPVAFAPKLGTAGDIVSKMRRWR